MECQYCGKNTNEWFQKPMQDIGRSFGSSYVVLCTTCYEDWPNKVREHAEVRRWADERDRKELKETESATTVAICAEREKLQRDRPDTANEGRCLIGTAIVGTAIFVIVSGPTFLPIFLGCMGGAFIGWTLSALINRSRISKYDHALSELNRREKEARELKRKELSQAERHENLPPEIIERIQIEKIRAWCKREGDAGRPCQLEDYYNVHGRPKA
jgi:hypothetical protein